MLVELLVRRGDEHHHQHADQRQEGADAEEPVVVVISMKCPSAFSLRVDEDEHDRTDRGCAEQQRAVLVDLAGLDWLQRVAGLGGD